MKSALWILCAISSANVVQKRVKSEFRGIRPLTTNNFTPSTSLSAAAGLADRGIPVPGTRYLVLHSRECHSVELQQAQYSTVHMYIRHR